MPKDLKPSVLNIEILLMKNGGFLKDFFWKKISIF